MNQLPDYEKLGVFYLGRQYDVRQKKTTDELVLFPSKNFVTHGLVVGMTGSGKTGLCLDIIEEAAMDEIPVIAIDPKGDLGNLLLTFPNLKPEEFRSWVNEDEAKKAGESVEEFAAKQAEFWKTGLAQWNQDADRIKRLRDKADFVIFTPGSSAGWPVSVVRSFEHPPPEVMEDGELFRERVYSTCASLLQLVGIEADPVQSRETVLLMNLIQNAWSKGRDLDLSGLIQEIQQPTIGKIGVLDVDSFYPAKERFDLAMRLNNLLASPSFAGWMQGEPLDVQRMLYTPESKPRVAIFSIAHLGDAERMFFVTLLLNQVLAWVRGQKGTSSLRALLYMDEIFGFFPPIANPPSKLPLLTLLKQARAFGLGVVLATQNPVDLDYKGLANIGTWFIGRLQTERDKARILEGLEGAAADQGGKFNRTQMEKIISGLASRIFLLHSVHDNAQALFESRWAMSYLSGPLSRTQIKLLMADRKPVPMPETAKTANNLSAVPAGPTLSNRPVLPPEVPQVFVPVREQTPAGAKLVYQPRLLGAASTRYTLTKAKLDHPQDVVVTVEVREGAVPVDWAEAEDVDIAVDDLESNSANGEFHECPPAVSQAKNFAKWSKEFVNWVYSQRRLELMYSDYFGLYSEPGESEADFKIRLQQAGREERDQSIEKLRRKYEPKLKTLQERLRKAEARVEREAEQAQQSKIGTVASVGQTILGAIFGKRLFSAGNIGKASSTVRSAGRVAQQSADVTRAEADVTAIKQEMESIESEFKSESDKAVAELEDVTTKFETIEAKTTKSNINVKLLALAWLPYHANQTGMLHKAY